MNYLYPSMMATLAAVLLSACSSSGDQNNSSDTQPSTGVFVDSAVEGLSYETVLYAGTTNAEGQFNYAEGESIVFSIGEIVFPAVTASPVISPVELADSSFDPEVVTLNIALLLQSLDSDGDTSNGITISPSAASVAMPLNFNQTTVAFTNDIDVINFVANAGSGFGALIDIDAAANHLFETLAGLNGADEQNTISGFWSFDESLDFVDIATNGDITFYDHETVGECYTTRSGSINQVEGPLYRVVTPDGIDQDLIITRESNQLNILLLGSLNLADPSVVDTLVPCL